MFQIKIIIIIIKVDNLMIAFDYDYYFFFVFINNFIIILIIIIIFFLLLNNMYSFLST